MIPIIRHEIVNQKKWITDEEISKYLTLSQSIPGVIAINTATAVGKKFYGLPGGNCSYFRNDNFSIYNNNCCGKILFKIPGVSNNSKSI